MTWKELGEFSYENGKPVLRPPQNWCYVKEANQGGMSEDQNCDMIVSVE